MLMLAEQEGRWQDAMTLRAHRRQFSGILPLKADLDSSATHQLAGVAGCLDRLGCGLLAPAANGAASANQMLFASHQSRPPSRQFLRDQDCMAAVLELSSWGAAHGPLEVCAEN
jgi:hypothetical protein